MSYRESVNPTTTNSFYDTPRDQDKVVLYPHPKVGNDPLMINVPEKLSTAHFQLEDYILMFSK